jgi:hypothetical protein
MQIQHALSETADGLGVRPGYDWSKQFYQERYEVLHNLRGRALFAGRKPFNANVFRRNSQRS